MSNGKLFSRTRRVALRSIGLLGGLLAARQLQASHTETHFEDTAEHRIVYQCNKADADYLQHILFSAGELELHVDCLPTRPVTVGRGVRLAIAVDGGEPRVLDGRGVRADVLANLRRYATTVVIDEPGPHTLTVWMVDPGVVVDKIVLYTAAPTASYLGPPESYWR